MKVYLELELRGDDIRQLSKMYRYLGNEVSPGLGDSIFSVPSSSWVAEIIGPHPKYRLDRSFLPYKKDYSRSNSVGSRGVYANYILDSGHIYDVKDNKDRYFCMVMDNGEISRLSKEDVAVWVKNISK